MNGGIVGKGLLADLEGLVEIGGGTDNFHAGSALAEFLFRSPQRILHTGAALVVNGQV